MPQQCHTGKNKCPTVPNLGEGPERAFEVLRLAEALKDDFDEATESWCYALNDQFELIAEQLEISATE